MNSLYFQTQTRWLVTVILLFALSISNVWGITVDFAGSSLPSGWSGNGSFNSVNNHYHSATPGYALNNQALTTSEYTNITALTFWGSTSSGGDGKSLTIQYKESGSNTWNNLASISLSKGAQVQKTVTVTSLAGKTVTLKFSTTWATAYIDDIEITTGATCSNKVTLTKAAPENGSFCWT